MPPWKHKYFMLLLVLLQLDELQMLVNSPACDEAAEERPPVIHGLLMSKILELMMKLDSVTMMEDSVVVQLADCLEQLNSVSEKIDRNDLSKLSSTIEKHIDTVYSLLNKFFDSKKFITILYIAVYRFYVLEG